MADYDVAIVGGGPAGLALARALMGAGLRLAVIERSARDDLAQALVDGREIALTHRSVESLRKLGAWQRIDEGDIAPLRAAHVLNGGSPFVLGFEPAGGESGQLGYLVPNHAIRRALFAAVDGQEGLDLITGASVISTRTSTTGARIELADGRVITARLLVGADSRFSAVRDQLGIPAEINRLGKSILVCRVRHEQDHHGIATEWFDHGQTYAILPLNGRMCSAVLTLASGEIDAIMALDWPALGAELTRRYGGKLGRMEVVEAPHAYPLATTWSRHFAAPCAALIGDAAVGMHPVTAHGFNLGLMSAMKLADLMRAAVERGGDIAAPMLLRRYEAAHRVAARAIYLGTNHLVGLYTAEHPAARLARKVALHAAARLPGLRQGVSRMLMQR